MQSVVGDETAPDMGASAKTQEQNQETKALEQVGGWLGK